MPCAPGTVFNPEIGVCDHPYNVPGCGGTTTPDTPATTTTQAATTTTPTPTPTTQTIPFDRKFNLMSIETYQLQNI